MRKPRLPVDWACFVAILGLTLIVFGLGIAFYDRFVFGAPSWSVVPSWTWILSAAGLGLALLAVAVYFSGWIQFVRLRGGVSGEFFDDLPIEGADAPLALGEALDAAQERAIETAPSRSWSTLTLLIGLYPIILAAALNSRLGLADLGPIRAGGTHWEAREVVVLGCGTVVLVFSIAFMLRRLWALQRQDLRIPPK